MGSTFAGKTHYLRHLFKKIYRNFHYGVVYSSTDKITKEYDWLPDSNRYDQWEDSEGKLGFKTVMERMLASQAHSVAVYGEKRCPRVFMIIEDPFGKIDFHHEPVFLTVAGQLRKYFITLFMLVQYVRYISPPLRNSTRKLFIFRNSEEDLRKLKELTTGFMTPKLWLKFAVRAVADYGGIMYDAVKGRFYAFRAPPDLPQYTMHFLEPPNKDPPKPKGTPVASRKRGRVG